MTMLERMARGMCQADGCDPDADVLLYKQVAYGARGHVLWQPAVKAWTLYQRLALGALDAIREPTEEMIVAAEREDEDLDFVRHWIAMIKAILNEKAEVDTKDRKVPKYD